VLVASDAAWVSPGAGGTGADSGLLTYRVASNAAVAPRVRLTLFAGQPSGVLPSRGTPAAAAGCSWRIGAEQGPVAWIAINPDQQGAGPAAISYTIQPNPSLSSRTANIVVRGDSGDAPRVCPSVASAGNRRLLCRRRFHNLRAAAESGRENGL